MHHCCVFPFALAGLFLYFMILGEMLNVNDAYAHPKFFRGIDEMTGFKTRYITYIILLGLVIVFDVGVMLWHERLCSCHSLQ